MNTNFLKKYDVLPQVVMRTPLMPYETLARTTADENSLKAAYASPLLQEALFLASPVLHGECLKWLKSEIKDRRENDRVVCSLMRYLLRMSTRPTPFGLFAGCTVGQVDDRTEIVLADSKSYQRHTRLDMHYLCALAQDLARHPLIEPKLKYYPNSSIYTSGEQVRYVEYRYHDKRRTHHLVAVDHSPYLQQVLDAAQQGAYVDELARQIVDEEISPEEAGQFVDALIENQLLVHDLEPAITGVEFLDQLLDTLRQIEGVEAVREMLEQVQSAIRQIDASEPGTAVQHYHDIAALLSKNLDTPFELNLLFQADMIKPAVECKLDRGITEQVATGIELLSRFSSQPKQTSLSRFRDAFTERYENREVPLLEVLDSETGIGYIQREDSIGDVNPLISGIALPAQETEYELRWNARESFLLKKYIEATAKGAYEIELTDKEVERFEQKIDQLPDTMAVMLSVVAGKQGEQPEKLYLSSAGGSSAANLLGRFCHADKDIHQLTRSITDHEKALHPEVIFAEVIHLPEARLGNILLRPVLRDYEIHFLAKPAVGQEFQIALSDLTISVSGNRVVLRSKRLNKEIIPRLSTAHNYSLNALPVYHFLCDLQTQNQTAGVGFHWGVLQNEYSFLPRVVYQNLILSPATWNLRKEEFEPLLKANGIEQVQQWRQSLRIPRRIALADGDNELVIDLDNLLCVKTLVDVIRNRPAINLVEFLFDEHNTIVKGEEGNFVNQFILSYVKKNFMKEDFSGREENRPTKVGDTVPTKVGDTIPTKVGDTSGLQRSFAPGDQWLYYKFYSGVKTADLLLTQMIKPLAEELLKEGIIEKWFFIRYADPKLHLRVRFYSSKPGFAGEVMERVNELSRRYLDQNLVWKIQTDMYQREIERYHADAMEMAEDLFFNDSMAVLQLLDNIEGDEGEKIRWLFGVRSVDELLNDFGFSLDQKLKLLELMKESFGREFGMNKDLKVQLDQKFREERADMEFFLSDLDETEYRAIADILRQRSADNAGVVAQLKSVKTFEELSELMTSYIHMLCNRLFKSRQRFHEMVLYDLMYRQYRSMGARQKKA